MPDVRSDLRGSRGAVLVVRMPPKVVDDTAEAIRREVALRLPNSPQPALVLDFSDVDLINSIGITVLLQIQDTCRRCEARMLLAAVPPGIETFLRQLKLDSRFPRASDVDEAVVSLEST